MVPDIIESMKDSPDEMNRKRYQVFVDLDAELEACRNQLTKLKREMAWALNSKIQTSNSHLYPSDHYGL